MIKSFFKMMKIMCNLVNLYNDIFKRERVKVKSLSCVQLFVTPWMVAYQAPPSMAFSRQEYWSGLPFPSPEDLVPTQGSNLGLRHYRQTLYHLSHQGSPLKEKLEPKLKKK